MHLVLSCFVGKFLKTLRKHTPECDFQDSTSYFVLKSLYISVTLLSEVVFEYI